MEINKIANDFLKYMKTLPATEYYKLFHGSFQVKCQMVENYVKTLHLDFSTYLDLKTKFDELESYATMMLTPPKKKKVVKKKIYEEEDSE